MSKHRFSHDLEVLVLIASIAVIPVIAIDNSNAGPALQHTGSILNWASWLVFAFEIVFMLAITPDRWGWIKANPLLIPITVLSPPFLPNAFPAVRLLRLLRLLRLIPALAFGRRLISAQGVKTAGLVAAATIVVAGLVFAGVEHRSTEDGLWWAISTVSTVGYGDIAPETEAGRGLAILIMLTGIGFVSLLTAFIADRFVRLQKDESQILAELGEIKAHLERLDGRVSALSGVPATRDARDVPPPADLGSVRSEE